MRYFRIVCATALLAGFGQAQAYAPKSALDHLQFDGVVDDDALKGGGQTRRQWLDQNPAPAKEYWRAWDCKGKPCDSKWQANIRAKAALIQRTDKDPPNQAGGTSSSH